MQPGTLRDWPPCLPVQRDGGRQSGPGRNPVISALTVARCSATHKPDSMETGSRLLSCRCIPIITHKRERKEADHLEKKKLGITSFGLHVFAMVFMLLDHLWATLLTDQHWMTNVGRLAFPIFAFLIAEGYFRTRNVKNTWADCLFLLSSRKFRLTL